VERRRRHALGLLKPGIIALAASALAATAGIATIGTGVAGAQSSATTTTTAGPGSGILPNRLSPPAPAAENSTATGLVLKAIATERLMGSVHLDGTIKQGKSVVSLHLVLDGDGDGAGQFTQGGTPIKLSHTGQLLYFNAPKKFWASHASKAEATKYGGRWLKFSSLDPNLASFDRFLNASDLVSATFMGHQTPLTLSQPTTFDHHKVVVVKDVSTTDGRTVTSTMDIASTGQAFVYRIVDKSPGALSTLVLSKYGKAVKIMAPSHALNLTSEATSTTTTTTTTAP
jgi:hypothetical protein